MDMANENFSKSQIMLEKKMQKAEIKKRRTTNDGQNTKRYINVRMWCYADGMNGTWEFWQQRTRINKISESFEICIEDNL